MLDRMSDPILCYPTVFRSTRYGPLLATMSDANRPLPWKLRVVTHETTRPQSNSSTSWMTHSLFGGGRTAARLSRQAVDATHRGPFRPQHCCDRGACRAPIGNVGGEVGEHHGRAPTIATPVAGTAGWGTAAISCANNVHVQRPAATPRGRPTATPTTAMALACQAMACLSCLVVKPSVLSCRLTDVDSVSPTATTAPAATRTASTTGVRPVSLRAGRGIDSV